MGAFLGTCGCVLMVIGVIAPILLLLVLFFKMVIAIVSFLIVVYVFCILFK